MAAQSHVTPTKLWALRRLVEVIGADIRARTRRRPSAEAADIPRSPAEITSQWLTAVLCHAVPEARVTAVKAAGGSVGTTTRRALEVSYNDAGTNAGLPTDLFVKCTTTLAQRLMLGLGGLIDGEPGFYNHIRPLLKVEAPNAYFAAADPSSWHSIVVMEEVTRNRGASFWNPSQRITRGQIEELLRGAAAWHGALWDSPRLSEWRWLRTPAEQMRLIDALIGLANRTRAGAARARAVIPPALRSRQEDLYVGLSRSMEIAGRDPLTYLHGDLHIANTYVTGEGRMGITDWQVGLRGCWAFDYAYLLTTALEVADRRAWENDLLELYLEHLAAAGGRPPSRAGAWRAYRQATFYPYFAWVYTIGRSRLQPRFQPDEVSLTMLERISVAIEDLDSLQAVGL